MKPFLFASLANGCIIYIHIQYYFKNFFVNFLIILTGIYITILYLEKITLNLQDIPLYMISKIDNLLERR